MLNEVLREINNFFIKQNSSGVELQFLVDATFTGTDTITGDFTDTFLVGEYIKIDGTRLNDGVYLITAIDTGSVTIDATLDLTIQTEPQVTTTFTKLFIPGDLVDLVAEITTFNTNTTNGITSESQGSRSISYSSSSSGDTSWRNAFNSRLSSYRKLRWC